MARPLTCTASVPGAPLLLSCLHLARHCQVTCSHGELTTGYADNVWVEQGLWGRAVHHGKGSSLTCMSGAASQVAIGRHANAQGWAQQSTHIVCQDGSRFGLQGRGRDKAEPEPVIGRRRDPGAHCPLQRVYVHLYPQVHPTQPHTHCEQDSANAQTGKPACTHRTSTAHLHKRPCKCARARGTALERQSCRRMLQEGQQRCEGWAGRALGDVLGSDLRQVAHALGGKVAQALQLPHLL